MIKPTVAHTQSQLKEASVTLARAFHYDPMLCYVQPEIQKRARILPQYFHHLSTYASLYGKIDLVSAFSDTGEVKQPGVALWLPPHRTSFTYLGLLWAGWAHYLLASTWNEISRLYQMMNYIEHIHQKIISTPHWYLVAIGVEPTLQGKGFGSRLLKQRLAQIQQENAPAYLETANPKDIPLYERNGFVVLHEGKLPNSSIPLWAMLRKTLP